MKTHLTHTGTHAGTPICGAARVNGGEYMHASYAPLHLESVRDKCCMACIATWLAYAYEPADPLPWPVTIEAVAELEKAIPQEFASDAEVAAFREKLRKATA